jgi:hypothetical protein
MEHEVYRSIAREVRRGRLREPFSAEDFLLACPGFAANTYRVFLPKHAERNPGRASVLFRRASRGSYRCVRPFKYGS